MYFIVIHNPDPQLDYILLAVGPNLVQYGIIAVVSRMLILYVKEAWVISFGEYCVLSP